MADQLEELFAELRAETISRVRPPGVGAARQTVRRRRLASGVAVAVAVAAVAGGVAVTAGGRSTHPAPAASSAVDLSRVVKEALTRQVRSGAPAPTRIVTVPATGQIAFPSTSAGKYQLLVACANGGSLTLDVRAGATGHFGGVVGCSAEPAVVVLPFALTRAGSVTISLSGAGGPVLGATLAPDNGPTESSPPESGSAETPTEESTFNAGLAGDLLTAHGATNPGTATTELPMPIELGTFGGGSAVMDYACVGPGRITFAVTITPLDGSRAGGFDDEVECTADGTVRAGNRTDLPLRSRVTITAVPDGAAANHAGWAWARMPW
jgi:hypothetical protein